MSEPLDLPLPGNRNLQVKVLSSNARLELSGDALLPMSLLIAMKHRLPLELAAPVSPRMLGKIPKIQDILKAWSHPLRRVEVQADAADPDRPTSRGVATFFSGGVDSFYTLLKHRDEITDLIFIHGYDMELSDTTLRERLSSAVREVGSVMGKRVIELEADLGAHFRGWLTWAHGAVLASMAHLLAPEIHRVYVPSSFGYASLIPWGSHPLLDPLWSSERLELLHDGCEATRFEKVVSIAREDLALNTLRVCIKTHQEPQANCGRCEKCLRTMISLRLVGALPRCTTLPRVLDCGKVARYPKINQGTLPFLLENLAAAEGPLPDREVARALRRALRRHRIATFIHAVERRLFRR